MALSLTQVQALFGVSSSSASTGSAAAAIPALRRVTADGAEAKGIETERKDAVSISALAQFRTALDKAETIEAALQDPRILKVLLPALGLSGQEDSPGLVRRALLSDPADSDGLAAQLGSTWQAAAATLGVHATGLDGLRDSAMVDRLSNAFLKYQYRTGLDDTQAGLSDALYFLESARTATDVYGILGDSVMRRVVTGALGLPDAMAIQSVETQGRAVTARLSIESLQDDKAVLKLAERYLIVAAGLSSASDTAADPFQSILQLSLQA